MHLAYLVLWLSYVHPNHLAVKGKEQKHFLKFERKEKIETGIRDGASTESDGKYNLLF